ncbi:hypothetical protein [Mesorhizobium erdmanii]|uniref:Uracil-DNA glycosylase-like domain-containing protein n=1 Tax=Mesorhizobium erdmanii TaxID=1777866 RepID=A0A6M7UQW7_9HYPH|nr:MULTISPECIES: hypothetical protein [Mesorhizobium]OBQ67974.1 hypothetical protein A8146_11185 [Mesorhizobium loti]QKC79414.1 hypothetical protein EB233_31610 [Mesorhizobium erdmanii]
MQRKLSLETVRALRHTLADLRDRDWQVGFEMIALFAPNSPRSHLVSRARDGQQHTISYPEVSSIDVAGSVSSALDFLLECYPDATYWFCSGAVADVKKVDPDGPYGCQCDLPGLAAFGAGWTPALAVLDTILAIAEWHFKENLSWPSSDEGYECSLPQFKFEELIPPTRDREKIMTDGMTWLVDKGSYKAAYYDAIESAKTSLPQTLVSQVSTPEAWALTSEYAGAKRRIMVMGQETFGNLTSLSAARPFHSWSAAIGESITFDFATGETQETSPFWRAYQEIITQLGLPSRRHTAWTNLAKVQLTLEDGPSRSISTLEPQSRMEVIRWQKPLFLAEMEFAKPDAIIMLTGSLTWLIEHMYENVQISQMGKEDEAFNIVQIPALNIPIVQTYHPAARAGSVTNVAGRRRNAVEHLISKINTLT